MHLELLSTKPLKKENSSPSTPLDPTKRRRPRRKKMLNDLSPLFLRGSGLGSLLLLPLQLSCELLAETPSQHRNWPLTCGLLCLHDGGHVLLVGGLLGTGLGVLVLLSWGLALLFLSMISGLHIRYRPASSEQPHGRSHAGYHGPSWLKGSPELLGRGEKLVSTRKSPG
jgi:hypothetical protein